MFLLQVPTYTRALLLLCSPHHVPEGCSELLHGMREKTKDESHVTVNFNFDLEFHVLY